MEATVALRSPVSLFQSSDLAPKSRFLASPCVNSIRFDQKARFSHGSVKGLGLPSKRPITPFIRRKRSTQIKASMNSSSDPKSQIAPLQFESPVGQFLSQILASHPHLLPAAVEQQLEQLQTDREAEKSKDEPTPTGNDLVLYKRIAEVKEKERRRALEEILYTLVVQKFVESGVSLIPAIEGPTDPSRTIDSWPKEDGKLERLHSPEAYEMIENHLTLILGNRFPDSNSSLPPISKLRIGQVYAASVMYGYFLKRVDQRFQLEKSIKSLPWGPQVDQIDSIKQPLMEEFQLSTENSNPGSSNPGSSFPSDFSESRVKQSRLRSYVLSFDPDTLQRYATIRSKEAFGIIEKHTEALFGRPEIVISSNGSIDASKDDLVKISFAGLKRLILEAVTFGSFLWDVESFVDSRYHFVTN